MVKYCSYVCGTLLGVPLQRRVQLRRRGYTTGDVNRESGSMEGPPPSGALTYVRRPIQYFCNLLTHLSRLKLLISRSMQLSPISSREMSPKRYGQVHHTRVQHWSVNESVALMWKRLRPVWHDWHEPAAVHHAPAPVAGTSPHTEAAERGRVRPPPTPLQPGTMSPLCDTSGVGQRLMLWLPLALCGPRE